MNRTSAPSNSSGGSVSNGVAIWRSIFEGASYRQCGEQSALSYWQTLGYLRYNMSNITTFDMFALWCIMYHYLSYFRSDHVLWCTPWLDCIGTPKLQNTAEFKRFLAKVMTPTTWSNEHHIITCIYIYIRYTTYFGRAFICVPPQCCRPLEGVLPRMLITNMACGTLEKGKHSVSKTVNSHIFCIDASYLYCKYIYICLYIQYT